VWLDVPGFLRSERKTNNVGVYSPMDVSLFMTPVYGAYNLGRPPQEVCFRNFAVKWAGFQHIPKGSTLDKVHDEV